MSDVSLVPDDPTTAPFWEAAIDGRIVVQRCGACGAHQLYPRPFCLACEANDLMWVDGSGAGLVYSVTINRLQVSAVMEPPYAIALVELEEGPRVLTHVDGELSIGDRVDLSWRAQPDALPTLYAVRA